MYFIPKSKPIQLYNIIYFDYTIKFYQDLFVYEIEGRISGNTKTESVTRGSVWDNFHLISLQFAEERHEIHEGGA